MLTKLFCCVFLMGPGQDTLPPSPPPLAERNEMYSHYQRQPEMPLCDYLETPAERQECMKEHIIKIIYGNLKWPPLARESCVTGMALISFSVTETGALEDFKIVRDPGAGTGEEALRVVKLLAQETGPWHPGVEGVDRRPVRVQYNMPVKFKLE